MTGIITLRCDDCGTEYGDVGAVTIDAARRIAESNGWTCAGGLDLCASHTAYDRSWFRRSHAGAFL